MADNKIHWHIFYVKSLYNRREVFVVSDHFLFVYCIVIVDLFTGTWITNFKELARPFCAQP